MTTHTSRDITDSAHRRHRARRRPLMVALLAVVLAATTSGCGDDDASAVGGASPGPSGESAASSGGDGNDVYFGYVFGRDEITAVALDLGAPDADGRRKVKAYVCDGLGKPEGLAVWFGDDVDPAATAGLDTGVEIAATGGDEILRIGNLNEYEVRGVFTDDDGTTGRFVATRAIDGAGIYELTLDADGHYTGSSTDGNQLVADIVGDLVEGTITTPDGTVIEFAQQSHARASAAELRAYGLSDAPIAFVDVDQLPDTYVAVVSPSGSHWFGRSGRVRDGDDGNNIIGLDMSD